MPRIRPGGLVQVLARQRGPNHGSPRLTASRAPQPAQGTQRMHIECHRQRQAWSVMCGIVIMAGSKRLHQANP